MLNGVITGKLQALDQVLAELQSLGTVNATRLEKEWLIRRAVERDLQVLVEIVIDICHCVISLEGERTTANGIDAIKRCIDKGILSESNTYLHIGRLQHFLIQRPEHMDANVMVDLVRNHLPDIAHFREEIVTHIGREDRETVDEGQTNAVWEAIPDKKGQTSQ